MERRVFLKCAALSGLGFWSAKCLAAEKSTTKPRPNILFILADDLGWMDTSVYGSRYYKTPNVDRLAKKGMLFTDAYSASPLCSPTRASLLTGKYPSREGLNITMPGCHLPPLAKDAKLMANSAAPDRKMVTPESCRHIQGPEYTYANAFKDAGYKTGVIGKWHLGLNEEHWPKNYGFDFDMGAPVPGPPSYFAPYKMKNFPEGDAGEYVTDRVTKEALRFIEANKNDPFVLSVWHFAVHAPYQAVEDITAKYRDVNDSRGKQDCAVMASMIESFDTGVGKLLDKLDELDLTDNTIIIFFSDNGGNMYDLVEGTTPTNNSPLRGGKGNIYEGGQRCPLIVSYPDVVTSGVTSDEIVSSVDIYPTMFEMAGIRPNPRQKLDGVSIVPVLKGGKINREAIFCHFPHYVPATQNLPSTSVRKGDYKLIRFYGEGEYRSNKFELYNLKQDIGETNNLAAKYPQKVKSLDKLIDGFIADTGSLVPVKNLAYIPLADKWSSSNDCSLSVDNSILKLKSSGNDPYIYTSTLPLVSNQMVLKFRMRSNIKGAGTVYFYGGRTKAFSKANSVDFEIKRDGAWNEYEVVFDPAGQIKGLRIDPGTSVGIAEFEYIELARVYGECLKLWDFM